MRGAASVPILLSAILLVSGCARPAGPPPEPGKARPAPGVRLVASHPLQPGPINDPEASPTAWAPSGGRLLYTAPLEGSRIGQVMLLDLNRPDSPVEVSRGEGREPRWSPDGRAVVYLGPREQEITFYRQEPADGEPVDLLPGEQVRRGMTGVKGQHRWLEPDLLAYREHMGTGIGELRLLKVPDRALLPIPRLAATGFRWSPDGWRVAGQLHGGPPTFWVWDRTTAALIEPGDPLPGTYQWFEAWSPDGQALLFSAWTGDLPYSERSDRPLLYRWDLRSGRVEEIAEGAAAAVWAGEQIAFLRLGEKLTLTLVDAAALTPHWSADLGSLPPDRLPALRVALRPLITGGYIAYADTAWQWRVTPLAKHKPRALLEGERVGVEFSPDARHLAVREQGENARLLVLENPLVRR
ncbi:MAG: hypothetical protein ACOY93_22775 [Bacillota bacterium]